MTRPSLRLAGGLMLLSGVTHLAQVLVYPEPSVQVGVGVFGIAYLAIGRLLVRNRPLGARLGAILPAIGGVGGTIRFFAFQPNPFSVGHVAIDLVVVPICVAELLRRR